MPKPGEYKTVQSRILKYAQDIGWTFVPRDEAEARRGFDPDVPPQDRAKGTPLFFESLLDCKIRQFNPRYTEAVGALSGKFRYLNTDIRPLPISSKAVASGIVVKFDDKISNWDISRPKRRII